MLEEPLVDADTMVYTSSTKRHDRGCTYRPAEAQCNELTGRQLSCYQPIHEEDAIAHDHSIQKRSREVFG